MLNDNTAVTAIDIDMFNTIIGYEENHSNSKKKIRSQRMSAARKAIETHREKKQLASYLDDIWLSE